MIHQPDKVAHILERNTEQEYVQLEERTAGVLALYRVRRDGKLKRLRRFPRASDTFTVGSDELDELLAEAS